MNFEIFRVLEAVSNNKKIKNQQMDTFLSLIKAWKQNGITKTHKMLKKKFESSFTFVTFKLFFAKIIFELLHIIL